MTNINKVKTTKSTHLSKSGAYIIGLVCLMLIFAANYLAHDNNQYGAIITGVVSLTTLYMGSMVAHNIQMGKNFNQEVWDATHKEEEDKK